MPTRLNEAVREFTRTVLNPFDLDDLLHRVTEYATATFEAVGAGILLEDDQGRLGFAAASNELIDKIGALQDEARESPAFAAFATTDTVAVDDLAAAGRWPAFTQLASDLGLGSVIAVPLTAWGQTLGVLSTYRGDPTHWTDDDREAGELLAAMAAGYILSASRMQAQHEVSEHLQAALRSRGVIERAKGLLMAQRGIDAQAAFEALRHASMMRNEKLRDIADEIVQGADEDASPAER